MSYSIQCCRYCPDSSDYCKREQLFDGYSLLLVLGLRATHWNSKPAVPHIPGVQCELMKHVPLFHYKSFRFAHIGSKDSILHSGPAIPGANKHLGKLQNSMVPSCYRPTLPEGHKRLGTAYVQRLQHSTDCCVLLCFAWCGTLSICWNLFAWHKKKGHMWTWSLE